MTYEEMISKIYVYKRHNLQYSNDVTRHIIDMKTLTDDYYAKEKESKASWGRRTEDVIECQMWSTVFRNDLASITRSSVISFNYILDVIEDFTETNKSEIEAFDMGPVWNYMEYLVELIWDLDSILSLIVRDNKDRDFRKSKRFQTICERFPKKDGSEELSNFIEIDKVWKKVSDFHEQTSFAHSYMSEVFTDQTSYKIKGDYINIFDSIVKSSELLYEEFYHVCCNLVSTVRIYYKRVKNPVLDTFTLFMTNVVFDNLIFSTFDKFAKVLYSVKEIMPKERSIV